MRKLRIYTDHFAKGETMSEQTAPLTYESVLALIRESAQEADKRRQESDRQLQELKQWFRKFNEEFNQQNQELIKRQEKTDEQIKRTNADVGGLTSSVGKLVTNMVKGNIIEKFEALGYGDLDRCSAEQTFRNKKLGIKGEIDLFLENGDVAILIEVKTSLEMKDVRKHIERLEKFRRYSDVRGDKRRFIGAVAGASVESDAEEFAHENGLYVIVQSGEAVEILSQPEGFVAKEW
jgi:hypothetical protein